MNLQEAYIVIGIDPIEPNKIRILNKLWGDLQKENLDSEEQKKLTAVKIICRDMELAPEIEIIAKLLNANELDPVDITRQILELVESTQDIGIIHFRLIDSLDKNKAMPDEIKATRSHLLEKIKREAGIARIVSCVVIANESEFDKEAIKNQILDLIESTEDLEIVHPFLMRALEETNEIEKRAKPKRRLALINIKKEINSTLKEKWQKILLAELAKKDKASSEVCLNCFSNGAELSIHSDGWTMLHVLVSQNNLSVVKQLLEKNTLDFNITSANDHFLLPLLLVPSSPDMIELLVSNGADLSILNTKSEIIFTFLNDKKLAKPVEVLEATTFEKMEKLVADIVSGYLVKNRLVKEQDLPQANSTAMNELLKKLNTDMSTQIGNLNRLIGEIEGGFAQKNEVINYLRSSKLISEQDLPEWQDKENIINLLEQLESRYTKHQTKLLELMKLLKLNSKKVPAYVHLLENHLATPEQLLRAELNKKAPTKITDNGKGQEMDRQNNIVNLEIIIALVRQGAPLNTQGTTSRSTLAHMLVTKLNLDIEKQPYSKMDVPFLYLELMKGSVLPLILKSDCTISDVEKQIAQYLMSPRMSELYQHSLNIQKQRQAEKKTNVQQLNEALSKELDKGGNADIPTINELISNGAEVNTQSSENGWTVAHLAAFRNNIAIIVTLVSSGADFNLPAKNGACPLFYANTIEIVIALVKGGANLHQKDRSQTTPWLGFTQSGLINKGNAHNVLIGILESDEPKNHIASIKDIIKLVGGEKSIKKLLSREQQQKLKSATSGEKTNFLSPFKKTKKTESIYTLPNLKKHIRKGRNFTETHDGSTLWNQFLRASVITQDNVNELLALALDVVPQDIILIKLFSNQFAANPNTQGTRTRRTVVHVAAVEEDVNFIEQLAQTREKTGFNRINSDGCPPLFLAKSIKTVKALLKGNANLACTNAEGLSALNYLLAEEIITAENATAVLAIVLDSEKPDIDVIETLINSGAGINTQGENSGFSPAHVAADQGNRALLIKLANKRADFNLKAKNPRAPALYYVHNNIEMAKILIKGGADLNWTTSVERVTKSLFDMLFEQLQNEQDKTILLSALLDSPFPNIQFIKRLIDSGADINTQGEISGLSVLHIAAQQNDISFIKTLGIRKAKLNLKERIFSRSPLFYALKADTITALLEVGADPERKGADGKVFFQHLFDAGIIDNKVITDVFTAELAKTQKANIKLLKLCVNYGANVNAKDINTGFTALHSAAMNGDRDFINVLFDYGADIDILDKESMSDSLMQPGEVVDPQKRVSFSALSMALDVDTVKLLIEKGADPDREFAPEQTVLQKLIERGVINQENAAAILSLILDRPASGLSSIWELIKLGADVNIQGVKSGRTAAHAVVKAFHKPLLQELANRGADFNLRLRNNNAYPPLFFAKDIETVEILVRGGADLFQICNEWTAFDYLNNQRVITSANATQLLAIILDNLTYPNLLKTIKSLRRLGADADVRGEKSGRTIAHIAAMHNNPSLIRKLCKAANQAVEKTKKRYDDKNVNLPPNELLKIKSDYLNTPDMEDILPIFCTTDINIVLALIEAGVSFFGKIQDEDRIHYLIKDELLTEANVTAILALVLDTLNPDIDLIKDLIARGANVNTYGRHSSQRAAQVAISRQDMDLLNTLINKNANVSYLVPDGSLVYQARHNLDMVKLLVHGGARLFDNDCNNARRYIYMLDEEFLTRAVANELLVIALDNVNYPDLDKTIEIFIERHGADINLKSRQFGRAPLHFAVGIAPEQPDLLECLLNKEGIAVDIQDNTGSSPLFYARNSATVHDLLAKNADFMLTNNVGTPAYRSVISENIYDEEDLKSAKNQFIKQDVSGKQPEHWNQPLIQECLEDNDATKLRLMKKLSNFIDNDIKRLLKIKRTDTYDLNNPDTFKHLKSSVQDKVILYSKLKKQIDEAFSKVDCRNVTGFIKRTAIIAHHRRHRTRNKIAKVLTFGLFSTNEAVSWNHFKKFAQFRATELRNIAADAAPSAAATLRQELRDVVFSAKARQLKFYSRKENKQVFVKGYEDYREHNKTLAPPAA
ncbi:MAG: hypothetical protein HKM04_09595 [Legionellales bacterium]|nr:hypothetical protein [Legionellales bacterium]